nr:hypothetical protein [Tanacetum cinerariifolium]
MPLFKKNEKVDVARGKGIKLQSEVALSKESQYEDIHKTHPAGSGIVTKTDPSVANIKPSIRSKGNDVKPGVPDVTEEES